MKPSLPTLELQYRRTGTKLPTVEEQMAELFRFQQAVSPFSLLLGEWFLASSKSKDEAWLYKAFDANGPTTAALAVIREKKKGVEDIRSISIWNGAETEGESAGLTSRCNVIGRPDAFEFGLKLRPEITSWKIGAEWIDTAIRIWPALFATFGPLWHSEKRVFADRPGVGWMLYLPRVLTVQQVPEARALVPVMTEGDGKKQKPVQLGTIIVSVTDEPFSDENPEHVEIANAIEVRLVDQDLLPRYADL
jgi:hypothetical protein